VTKCQNGKNCEVRVFRCYGTRLRAASSRRNNHQQGGSVRTSPLSFSPIDGKYILCHRRQRKQGLMRFTPLPHVVIIVFMNSYLCVSSYISLCISSRAKWRTLIKCSHEIQITERTEVRLLYITQTGEQQVFSIRRGNPVQRFLPKRNRKPSFFASISKPHHGFCLGLRRDRKI